jgi:hypothetical protein
LYGRRGTRRLRRRKQGSMAIKMEEVEAFRSRGVESRWGVLG